MAPHILGIRHHGPGSARNVKAFLEKHQPDMVLIEGPPEGDALLQYVNDPRLQPPVAILCYQPDAPQHSVFYPFAEFSAEWQAILYARKNNIPVRFFDLPIANQLAIRQETDARQEAAVRRQQEESGQEEENRQEEEVSRQEEEVMMHEEKSDDPISSLLPPASLLLPDDLPDQLPVDNDPISYLARAAGYTDGEKWWEHMFEHRHDNVEVFEAVTEAMQTLRDNLHLKHDRLEALREAHMRKMMRHAAKDMFQNIAVVCGAWHAPALPDLSRQKEDNDLLKNLPKVKVECTWVPWTYSRLSNDSGYGAGIHSPGWYGHIWHHPTDDGTRWMAKVARLFRENGMDTSVAHVVEAVRLATALASLRQLHKAGLEELNEATLSVLCNGEPILLTLIRDQLIVSNQLGEVPADIPRPPLQVDIEQWQKSLRLPPTADFKDYTLDLRKETDLQRSVLLHRLRLLEIKWGTWQEVSGKGTFKEQWRLQWDPVFSIDIIEKGAWGNTVEEAANNFVMHQTAKAVSLQVVSGLLQEALPAELHKAVDVLIAQINNLSAASGDVIQLMEVIPSLVTVSRYGNVRKTDADLVLSIATSMIIRICVSLPNAVIAIDEDAARHLLTLFYSMHEAVAVLQQPGITASWQETLKIVAYNKNTVPVIGGYVTRLLTDVKLLHGAELIKVFGFHMSANNASGVSAAWLEGFLKGSGTILLIDDNLWHVVNNWVADLDEKVFTEVLPLLRRTFANFSGPERRKLGEKVRGQQSNTGVLPGTDATLDHERAKQGIPVVLQLFGYIQ